MSEQTEPAEREQTAGGHAGVKEPAANTGAIRRPKVITRFANRRRKTGSGFARPNAAPGAAGLTNGHAVAHTAGQGGRPSDATPAEAADMARTPENQPDYYDTFDNDPSVPDADATIGPPEEPVEPEAFADLSKPDEFDDDVRAIVEAVD
jgi:hypothetical protein